MAAFWTIAILILTPIAGFIGQTFDLGAIFAVTAATVLLSLQISYNNAEKNDRSDESHNKNKQ